MTLVEVAAQMKLITDVLALYTFRAQNEDELQAAVAKVLRTHAGLDLEVDREELAARGRYDIAVRTPVHAGMLIVLELKVSGSASAVERQAQRYALTSGVSGVMVVTSSNRLAAQLKPGLLGGKPLAVVALRSTF